MSVNQPDLTGNTDNVRSGVTGTPGVTGGTSTASSPPALIIASPLSATRQLQQRWRPQSLLNFHQLLQQQPAQASKILDDAVQRAHIAASQLENMIACTQLGQSTVTGSLTGVPTGLTTVTACSGSIDNGATAHNFTLSVTPSQFPGAIDIHVWQPTAAGNTTPIACTSAVTVRWVAQGAI